MIGIPNTWSVDRGDPVSYMVKISGNYVPRTTLFTVVWLLA